MAETNRLDSTTTTTSSTTYTQVKSCSCSQPEGLMLIREQQRRIPAACYWG